MRRNLAVMFATAALLAACGGDDGHVVATPAPAPAPAPAAAPAVPGSASASVDTFFDYLVSLLSTSSETAAPLAIPAGFTTPVSESASPRNLP